MSLWDFFSGLSSLISIYITLDWLRIKVWDRGQK